MAQGDSIIGKQEDGAGDRARTGDLDLGKVALYQLSYARLAIEVRQV